MNKERISIPYVNLANQWEDEREELLPIIDRILGSGQYVGGDEIIKFEEKIARICNVDYAIDKLDAMPPIGSRVLVPFGKQQKIAIVTAHVFNLLKPFQMGSEIYFS